MTGGCSRLLSTEAVSLLSLSLSLSLAPLMPPLLSSSLYLVSLCASTAGFDRVFRVCGVGCVAVQDALARGSRHSTSRDSSVVAGGRSGAVRAAGAAGDPRRARLDRRAKECKRGGRRSSRAPVCCRANALCTASFASSSPASPSRLLSPVAERARCASPRRRRRALETRWG